MQGVADIKFDELLKIVKNLPENKLSELKAEIEKEAKEDYIAKTRKAINQWRKK